MNIESIAGSNECLRVRGAVLVLALELAESWLREPGVAQKVGQGTGGALVDFERALHVAGPGPKFLQAAGEFSKVDGCDKSGLLLLKAGVVGGFGLFEKRCVGP